jgi:prepilin peptidase dependent protein B
MIAVMLGMSVISSVLIGYLATYSGSISTLANSKLSQEMATLMDVMVNDIRRAGYTNNSAVANAPANNAFSLLDVTALEVYDGIASNQAAATGSGTCIVYSYDADRNATVASPGPSPNELFGFRLTAAGVVQTRTLGNLANPDTCETANNTWVDLTDPDFMFVTALNFDLALSACVNTREPNLFDDDGVGGADNATEADCYVAPFPVPGSGDITVETRQVDITLTANLTNDAFVRMSITKSVRIRNDWVRVH